MLTEHVFDKILTSSIGRGKIQSCLAAPSTADKSRQFLQSKQRILRFS